MADRQSRLAHFMQEKAAFLAKVRNATATDGIINNGQEMEAELVRSLPCHN